MRLIVNTHLPSGTIVFRTGRGKENWQGLLINPPKKLHSVVMSRLDYSSGDWREGSFLCLVLEWRVGESVDKDVGNIL